MAQFALATYRARGDSAAKGDETTPDLPTLFDAVESLKLALECERVLAIQQAAARQVRG